MAIKTTVSQSETYQANSVSTKYINKVNLSADGTLSVTATPIVKKNLLPPVTTVKVPPTNTNQITANSRVNRTKATVSPATVTTDPQGIILLPQPPGPQAPSEI